jgi:hypothetical protein
MEPIAAAQKSYTYLGTEYLTRDSSEISELSKIHICTYRINKTGKTPFLQFVMEYMMDSFSFPSFTYISDTFTLEEVVEKLSTNKIFQGFYVDHEKKDDVYLFFESEEPVTSGDMFYREDRHWYVTIDEIVNLRSVCNIPINPVLTYFFLNNPFMGFIKDENKRLCEIPILKYAGTCEPLLKNRSIFGIPPEEKTAILGPYYYFTDFNGAVRNGGWSLNGEPEYVHNKLVTEENSTCGKYKKGGIIRFVIFLGSMKTPMNKPGDDVDLSLTKQALLELDKKHRQTMRISDHDGKWTEKFDSVKLGCLELDDGSRLMDSPLWVVKDYDRIIPISYHYIDNTSLGETWSKDANYQIQ